MYPDQIYNLYSDLAFSSPQPKARGNKSILQEEQSAGLQSLGLNDTYKTGPANAGKERGFSIHLLCRPWTEEMNHYNTSDLNQTKCNEKNGINVCTKLCTFLLFYKGMNNKSQESLQISIKSRITV